MTDKVEMILKLAFEIKARQEFMEKLHCPNSGDMINYENPVPCPSCGEVWTRKGATKYYHGTAEIAFQRMMKNE